MKTTVNHPIVGAIDIYTNLRCRGIVYSINTQRAKISCHPSLLSKILPIAEDKITWFVENGKKLLVGKGADVLNIYSRIKTLRFAIEFFEDKNILGRPTAKLIDNILYILVPPQFDFTDTTNQTFVKKLVFSFLKIEAQKFLPNKLKAVSEKVGLKYNSTRITSTKSRWGSCSSKSKISLSCILLFLPEYLIDFVVVHELCHTKQMNHGAEFYSELGRIYPNFRDLNRELKQKTKEIRCWL